MSNMKSMEKYLGMDEKETAKVMKRVRKEYIRKDEYEDTDDLEMELYEELKDIYSDDLDKFYLATIMMKFSGIDITSKVKEEIEENWNSLATRVMG